VEQGFKGSVGSVNNLKIRVIRN